MSTLAALITRGRPLSRPVSLALGGLALSLALIVGPSPAHADSSPITLTNAGTSYALDSNAQGSVYGDPPNGGSYQYWTPTDLGNIGPNGEAELEFQDLATSMCLYSPTTPYELVNTEKCTNGMDEKWNEVLQDNGTDVLQNAATGLVLSSNAAVNGAATGLIYTYPLGQASAGSQDWHLTGDGGSGYPALCSNTSDRNKTFTGSVTPGNNQALRLAVPQSSTTPGTGVIDWTKDGGAEQNWCFSPQDPNTFEIINQNSKQCLTTDGKQHDQVYQAPCEGTTHAAQVWKTGLNADTNGSDGFYTIQSVLSGLYLEVQAPNVLKEPPFGNGGEVIDTWPANGGSNQQWAGNYQALDLDPGPLPPGP
jgi:Ricin-type beta-trefoil lectin domain-like